VGKEWTFKLQIENRKDKPLYVYVYNLRPYWQIYNIYCGSYRLVHPQDDSKGFSGKDEMKLKTTLPAEMREKSHRQFDDIIKVFITSQPTSFDMLELPKLNGLAIKNTSCGTIRESEGNSSEDWVTFNFPIRTYLR